MGYQIENPEKVAATIQALSAASGGISNDVNVRVRSHPLDISVTWHSHSSPICGFTLIEQPNCCGVLISTRTWVSNQYQRQGIATAMMAVKEAIARKYGYSSLVATVTTENTVEIHVLEKHGWVKGFEFLNQRTKRTVAFYHKDLND